MAAGVVLAQALRALFAAPAANQVPHHLPVVVAGPSPEAAGSAAGILPLVRTGMLAGILLVLVVRGRWARLALSGGAVPGTALVLLGGRATPSGAPRATPVADDLAREAARRLGASAD